MASREIYLSVCMVEISDLFASVLKHDSSIIWALYWGARFLETPISASSLYVHTDLSFLSFIPDGQQGEIERCDALRLLWWKRGDRQGRALNL